MLVSFFGSGNGPPITEVRHIRPHSFCRIDARFLPTLRFNRVSPQYARAREVIPWSAMPDRKLVMPSFRIEMRDGSPQSRPAGWPAAGPPGNATPGSWTAGSRPSGVGRDAGGAGWRRSKWSTCIYTSILLGSVTNYDATRMSVIRWRGGDKPYALAGVVNDDRQFMNLTFDYAILSQARIASRREKRAGSD